jgi:hypothetical protein
MNKVMGPAPPHHVGIIKILQHCGPQTFQEESLLEAFRSCRALLVGCAASYILAINVIIIGTAAYMSLDLPGPLPAKSLLARGRALEDSPLAAATQDL